MADDDTTIDHVPPLTMTGLAGIVERAIREGNHIDGGAAEIGVMSGLIAHHGCRYAVAKGFTLYDHAPASRLERAERRLKRRVASEMPQSAIGIFLLQSLISWGIRAFFKWLFADRGNRTAVAALGAPLPAWGSHPTELDEVT